MKAVLAWVKQPSTLVALSLVAGGAAYWFTGNPVVAAMAAGAVCGSVNDNTKALLTKVEALEDAARPLVTSEVK
jgi:hypothetical protein